MCITSGLLRTTRQTYHHGHRPRFFYPGGAGPHPDRAQRPLQAYLVHVPQGRPQPEPVALADQRRRSHVVHPSIFAPQLGQ